MNMNFFPVKRFILNKPGEPRKNITMLKFTMISAFLLGCAMISAAQNAPVTTCATVSATTPGTVSVPVTVAGFNNIGAVSLTLDYDYAVVHFIQGIPNPSLPNFLSGDSDLGNGIHRISIGWYGSSKTLADGTTIMTLNFNYIGGNSALNWIDNGSSCEYADGNSNVLNDTPNATYYLNGYICGGIGNPGPVTGSSSVCRGQTGVPYSVAALPNVTGYTWTLPAGAVITNGQNTNSITVDFSASAVSGNVTVFASNPCGNGPSSQLQMTVNPLPVANAGNDVTINYGTSTTLHAASGGSGNYSYHWSPEAMLVNPNVQDPQTVVMTATTLFTVVVTSQGSSCQASDDVTVTITGGPLNANPIAVPGEICHGAYSHLYSNAGNGSGNYTYQWTCIPPGTPPWSSAAANPVVSPETSTTYNVIVNDGFTSISGTVNLGVIPLPTATISGGDTLCGTGNSTTLRVDLTGTPPWSFMYSNGIATATVLNQYTTPYTFATGEPGLYTIADLQDANCTGTTYGSASVNVFPVPAVPAVTLIDNMLISSVCCGNQWYVNNQPIPGATGQTFLAQASGLYYDIITLNGCSSDTSQFVGVIVGLNEITGQRVTLSPNPADDVVKIHFPGSFTGTAKITFASVVGRVLGSCNFIVQENQNDLSVDLSRFAPGIYIVTVNAVGLTMVSKLIIK